jgi:hypothetical protein
MRFSDRDLRRIGHTVRYVESIVPGPEGVGEYDSVLGPGMHLAKTKAAFNVDTIATVDLYGHGTPGSEEKSGELTGVINKFGDIPTGKWIWVAQSERGFWYVTAAGC